MIFVKTIICPPFSEKDVEKYFLHFERVIKELLALLFLFFLAGKAQEAYSSLSIKKSTDCGLVKASIVRAYELAAEAYQQHFHGCSKDEA